MLPDKKIKRDQDKFIDLEHEEPEEQEQVSNEHDQLQQILARNARIAAKQRGEETLEQEVEQLPVKKAIRSPRINNEWSPFED